MVWRQLTNFLNFLRARYTRACCGTRHQRRKHVPPSLALFSAMRYNAISRLSWLRTHAKNWETRNPSCTFWGLVQKHRLNLVFLPQATKSAFNISTIARIGESLVSRWGKILEDIRKGRAPIELQAHDGRLRLTQKKKRCQDGSYAIWYHDLLTSCLLYRPRGVQYHKHPPRF